MEEKSFIERLPPQKLRELSKSLSDEEAAFIGFDWEQWARPKQLPPPGDWDGWLIMAGRGFGKTRVGAETVRAEVESGRSKRIALIAETSADGRDVMVEGESGILSVCPPWDRPLYEPSKRRLTWNNGAVATLYDAREPDQLRGPQHDFAWLDEMAKYRYAQEVFEQMLFGLRLGIKPRWFASTTPRPIPLMRALVKDPRVVTVRGSSDENMNNLAPSFKRNVIDRFRGTRLGRQELDAEILDDIPGALWSRRMLDEHRVGKPPAMKRIVVGVDPAATSGEGANETGIIVAGIDAENHGYTLDDYSLHGTPDAWARRAVSAYRRYSADKIVAECNQGGEMVKAVINSVDPNVSVTLVRATRGKYVRAEPVSAIYEQGRAHHVGTLPALEDQMIAFTPDSLRDAGESPDRVDALVWAYTELFPEMTTPLVDRFQNDDWDDYEYSSSRSPVSGY